MTIYSHEHGYVVCFVHPRLSTVLISLPCFRRHFAISSRPTHGYPLCPFFLLRLSVVYIVVLQSNEDLDVECSAQVFQLVYIY